MSMDNRRIDFRILITIIVTIILFGVAQSIIHWGPTAFNADHLWGSIAIFVLPVFAAFLLFVLTLHWILKGPRYEFARKWAWAGFLIRLACAAMLPLILYWSGVTTGLQQEGIFSSDAQINEKQVWGMANENISMWEVGRKEMQQPNGGLIGFGVFLYRFFSATAENPMVLTLWMAFFSAGVVMITYRLAEKAVSPQVARGSALFAALFPDGVLVGSAFLSQGILAVLLGVLLFCCLAFVAWDKSEWPEWEIGSPWKLALAAILIFVVIGIFFSDFIYLFLVIFVVSVAWFIDLRTRIGKWLSVAIGGILSCVVLLSVLAFFHMVPSTWDVVGNAKHYFFDYAWEKMGITSQPKSNDLLENIIGMLPKPIGFFMIAVYGLLQPFLPFILGSKTAWASEGILVHFLAVVRAIGWFSIIPFIFYGTLAAGGNVRKNKFPFLCGILVLLIAFIGGLRSSGDQWDNPVYRTIALAPMACLVAWTWVTLQEGHSPWFMRILIPFLVGVFGLLGWNLMRSYFDMTLPALNTFIAIGLTGILLFIFLVIFHIPHMSKGNNLPTKL
jgi:hypothetical protein